MMDLLASISINLLYKLDLNVYIHLKTLLVEFEILDIRSSTYV